MQYIITFLEGIITFISPCLLPMLPIYVSFFSNGENNKKKTFQNAIGFVAGFTTVFVILGAFAGTMGSVLTKYKTEINIVTGLIVVILGLNFIGIIQINFLNGTKKIAYENKGSGLVASFLFGIIFSIGWTPCVGAFLGSALMLASQKGSLLEGIFMLITYSIGLGIPFVISALLIDKGKATFDFIKRNYGVINKVSGIFLVLVGIFMMSGLMGYLLSFLSF
ncbi:MAG: cytochrome c biogenesis CcdA family protein [Velocimicrobium sp.]